MVIAATISDGARLWWADFIASPMTLAQATEAEAVGGDETASRLRVHFLEGGAKIERSVLYL